MGMLLVVMAGWFLLSVVAAGFFAALCAGARIGAAAGGRQEAAREAALPVPALTLPEQRLAPAGAHETTQV